MSSSSTNSGIKVADDGSRFVGGSVRADGSVRKTIKIRPGFVPQEDVPLFRTRAQRNRETGINSDSSISKPADNKDNNSGDPAGVSVSRSTRSPHLRTINSILSAGNNHNSTTGSKPWRGNNQSSTNSNIDLRTNEEDSSDLKTGTSRETSNRARNEVNASSVSYNTPNTRLKNYGNGEDLDLAMSELSITTPSATAPPRELNSSDQVNVAPPTSSKNSSVSPSSSIVNVKTDSRCVEPMDKNLNDEKDSDSKPSSKVSRGKYILPSKRV